MKNILLALLLANILYFMWGMFTEEDPQPGVAVVEESDLGPPLDVTAGRDRDAIASVGAVLGSGEPSALEAVVGRSCVTIGPFRDSARADADSAVLDYRNQGMQVALRSEMGEQFIGHSVTVPNVPNRAAGRGMIDRLTEAGLGEAFIVGNDEVGYSISIGIFGSVANAERVEIQAESAGFEVDIAEMTRPGTEFFVDIGLPPGKGAGAIIEKYGEDRVRLRENANCPI